jgi:hypothetical protein
MLTARRDIVYVELLDYIMKKEINDKIISGINNKHESFTLNGSESMGVHGNENFLLDLSSLTIFFYFIQCSHYVHNSYKLCIYDDE